MDRLSAKTLCQVYVLLILLVAVFTSALTYSLLALVLLMVTLFITLRPIPPRLNVVVTAATVFLVPQVLAPLLSNLTALPLTTGQIISVVLIFPAIYLLDYNLRQNAQNTPTFMKGRTGRHTTYTYVALLSSALVLMLISFPVNNPVLLLTGITLAIYLLGVLIGLLITIPRLPLTTPTTGKRIIAGTTASMPLHITSKVARMYGLIDPIDPWVKAMPQRFTLIKGKTRLNLNLTPPLAGPSRPQCQVSIIDSRGFIQINQLLEPLALHVIPRAKYAEWLARKYLEQAGTGVVTATTVPAKVIKMPKRGVEYFDSRTYQPGDQLKDIDWKHTLKLSQPIVKEYIESGEQAAIIAVNLSVADAEEADKLAFNLITVALTLAREGIPAALAAYNEQRVVLSTAVTEPVKILREALSLVREITPVKLVSRYLDPADIAKIRRNILHLKQAESEPAQRLLDMLNFEYQAIEEAAKKHPATAALSSVTEQAPVPAMILLVTQFNHDAEAIMVTAERLSKRGFTTMPVEATI